MKKILSAIAAFGFLFSGASLSLTGKNLIPYDPFGGKGLIGIGFVALFGAIICTAVTVMEVFSNERG